jgi:hypothetical protein
LKARGLESRVDLLAFDAKRTPFRTGSVPTLTTYAGLLNIMQPGSLLDELRRIVGGTFLAVTHFYPEDESTNSELIRSSGLSSLMHREPALAAFRAAGWQVRFENRMTGRARPTPQAELLPGFAVDGLPVEETELEWGVLVAT